MKVEVVSLKKDWDMRCTHELRDSRAATQLKRGQCLMAFNTRRSMCRMIDSVGGVHTWYRRPEDGVFDVRAIAKLMKEGLAIELQVGRKTTQRAKILKLAA